MVLEATYICVDNSEWMRNGDMPPSRMEAQHDAVNLVAGAKLQGNPENTVGVLTMAENKEVLITLTTDMGRILNALHRIQLKGQVDLINSLQIAQLALKHRESKTHKQRIIAFVGSPVIADEAKLVKLGKALKKNNVSVDIISFGEQNDNQEKLEAFMNAVTNKESTSHMVTIPAGPYMMSDTLVSSPILATETGGGPRAGGVSGDMGGLGVDPNVDPELAMALRISMMEERQRQEQEGKTEGEEPKTDEQPTTNAPDLSSMTDEEQLAYALQISQQQDAQTPTADNTQAENNETAPMEKDNGDKPAAEEPKKEDTPKADEPAVAPMDTISNPAPDASGPDVSQFFEDPQFLASVLGDLPGVDPNDNEIRNVLEQFGQKPQEDKDKKEEKKDEEK
eukprot:m.264439 g.264439  ORF g.264439 m.264439 type:complete len:395 (+) comp27828_c0_seq1:45-1229(+)